MLDIPLINLVLFSSYYVNYFTITNLFNSLLAIKKIEKNSNKEI